MRDKQIKSMEMFDDVAIERNIVRYLMKKVVFASSFISSHHRTLDRDTRYNVLLHIAVTTTEHDLSFYEW